MMMTTSPISLDLGPPAPPTCPRQEGFTSVSLPPHSNNTNGGGPRAHLRCYNCQELGHVSQECPKPKMMICYNCHKEGHKTFQCILGKRCHLCNQSSHLVRDCPMNKSSADTNKKLAVPNSANQQQLLASVLSLNEDAFPRPTTNKTSGSSKTTNSCEEPQLAITNQTSQLPTPDLRNTHHQNLQMQYIPSSTSGWPSSDLQHPKLEAISSQASFTTHKEYLLVDHGSLHLPSTLVSSLVKEESAAPIIASDLIKLSSTSKVNLASCDKNYVANTDFGKVNCQRASSSDFLSQQCKENKLFLPSQCSVGRGAAHGQMVSFYPSVPPAVTGKALLVQVQPAVADRLDRALGCSFSEGLDSHHESPCTTTPSHGGIQAITPTLDHVGQNHYPSVSSASSLTSPPVAPLLSYTRINNFLDSLPKAVMNGSPSTDVAPIGGSETPSTTLVAPPCDCCSLCADTLQCECDCYTCILHQREPPRFLATPVPLRQQLSKNVEGNPTAWLQTSDHPYPISGKHARAVDTLFPAPLHLKSDNSQAAYEQFAPWEGSFIGGLPGTSVAKQTDAGNLLLPLSFSDEDVSTRSICTSEATSNVNPTTPPIAATVEFSSEVDGDSQGDMIAPSARVVGTKQLEMVQDLGSLKDMLQISSNREDLSTVEAVSPGMDMELTEKIADFSERSKNSSEGDVMAFSNKKLRNDEAPKQNGHSRKRHRWRTVSNQNPFPITTPINRRLSEDAIKCSMESVNCVSDSNTQKIRTTATATVESSSTTTEETGVTPRTAPTPESIYREASHNSNTMPVRCPFVSRLVSTTPSNVAISTQYVRNPSMMHQRLNSHHHFVPSHHHFVPSHHHHHLTNNIATSATSVAPTNTSSNFTVVPSCFSWPAIHLASYPEPNNKSSFHYPSCYFNPMLNQRGYHSLTPPIMNDHFHSRTPQVENVQAYTLNEMEANEGAYLAPSSTVTGHSFVQTKLPMDLNRPSGDQAVVTETPLSSAIHINMPRNDSSDPLKNQSTSVQSQSTSPTQTSVLPSSSTFVHHIVVDHRHQIVHCPDLPQWESQKKQAVIASKSLTREDILEKLTNSMSSLLELVNETKKILEEEHQSTKTRETLQKIEALGDQNTHGQTTSAVVSAAQSKESNFSEALPTEKSEAQNSAKNIDTLQRTTQSAPLSVKLAMASKHLPAYRVLPLSEHGRCGCCYVCDVNSHLKHHECESQWSECRCPPIGFNVRKRCCKIKNAPKSTSSAETFTNRSMKQAEISVEECNRLAKNVGAQKLEAPEDSFRNGSGPNGELPPPHLINKTDDDRTSREYLLDSNQVIDVTDGAGGTSCEKFCTHQWNSATCAASCSDSMCCCDETCRTPEAEETCDGSVIVRGTTECCPLFRTTSCDIAAVVCSEQRCSDNALVNCAVPYVVEWTPCASNKDLWSHSLCPAIPSNAANGVEMVSREQDIMTDSSG